MMIMIEQQLVVPVALGLAFLLDLLLILVHGLFILTNTTILEI